MNQPSIERTTEGTNEALRAVVKAAMTDPELRRLALADPVAAVKQVTDKELPPGFKVRFAEHQGANLTVVLPDPLAAGEALSDAELEVVAGGVENHNSSRSNRSSSVENHNSSRSNRSS